MQHKITAAILVSFNAAHRAAATASASTRAFLVDCHVKALEALVKRADSRVQRFTRLGAYHRAQAYTADHYAGKAKHEAGRVAALAAKEAAKHGVDKQS